MDISMNDFDYAFGNKADKLYEPEKNQYELGMLAQPNISGIPFAYGFDSVLNKIDSKVNWLLNDYLANLGLFYGYDSDRHYKAFDKVIIDSASRGREIYQVYNPQGVQGIDPEDSVNRPLAWNNPDPTIPYAWVKLGKNGERGQIGTIITAMSHQRQENWIPAVGGTFEVPAGLLPWVYEAMHGRLPSDPSEIIRFGIREEDFICYISESNSRQLNTYKNDAMRKIIGTFSAKGGSYDGWSGAFHWMKSTNGTDSNGASSGYTDDMGFDSSRVTPTDTKSYPSHTAFTAFLVI